MTAGADVALVAATDDDRELLFQVYASTRAEELAVVPWPDAAKEAFLRQQFAAQDVHYRGQYPGATFEVIVVDGEPAGRLYLWSVDGEIRIMDIALLPPFRRQGIGSRLIGNVLAAAAARGACVTIHVEGHNQALAWYQRLGFAVVEERGPYLFLRFPPIGTGTSA